MDLAQTQIKLSLLATKSESWSSCGWMSHGTHYLQLTAKTSEFTGNPSFEANIILQQLNVIW